MKVAETQNAKMKAAKIQTSNTKEAKMIATQTNKSDKKEIEIPAREVKKTMGSFNLENKINKIKILEPLVELGQEPYI
jgi:hypothetical protein